VLNRLRIGLLLCGLIAGCKDGERVAERPAAHAGAGASAPTMADSMSATERRNRRLDSLVSALDGAGGFFAIEDRSEPLVGAKIDIDAFRAAGEPALHRLVDCMSDTTSTTTEAGIDETMGFVTRGSLCYEVLMALIRVSRTERPLPAPEDALYPRSPANGGHLLGAQRAWRAVLAGRAYDWTLGPPP
jgi:hypothetical protein